MRSKSVMLLLLALGCGLVASIGINQAMSRPHVDPGVEAESTPIFVAKAEIQLGDVLKPETVNLEPWPKDKVPQGAITKLEEIEGRRARTKIYPGEAIIEPKLLGKGEETGSAIDVIPKGFRVVSIKVDAVSGAAGLLKPGDRVDVLVHLQGNSGTGIKASKTKMFLQRVKVFAVDDVFRRDDDGRQSVAAKTISLLVTPSQAELVTTATELGTIRLVMRGASDEEDSQTPGAETGDILGNTSSESGPQADAAALFGEPRTPKSPVPAPVVQAPPPVVAPQPTLAPPRKLFKMTLLLGAESRTEVEFEDGKPVAAAEQNVPAVTEPAADGSPPNGSAADPPPQQDPSKQEPAQQVPADPQGGQNKADGS